MAERVQVVYRYTGDRRVIGFRGKSRALVPGQFISRVLFEELNSRDTIRQEIRRG